MYELIYSKSALKNLMKIPKNIREKIIEKLRILKINPYAQNNNVKKLVGLDVYRIRIGDYRIIYKIENQIYKILIVSAGIRGEIYK